MLSILWRIKVYIVLLITHPCRHLVPSTRKVGGEQHILPSAFVFSNSYRLINLQPRLFGDTFNPSSSFDITLYNVLFQAIRVARFF